MGVKYHYADVLVVVCSTIVVVVVVVVVGYVFSGLLSIVDVVFAINFVL